MALRRFYTDQELQPGWELELPMDEAEHIRRSLRMQPGDPLLIFNGRLELRAELTEISRDRAKVKLIEIERELEPASHPITLFQSLIKPANFELVLQKATELGVSAIVPLATEYTQMKSTAKPERLKKIVIEACKQSERISVPEVSDTLNFSEMLERAGDFHKLLLFTMSRDSDQVVDLHQISGELGTPGAIGIVIGPEGGFSPAELRAALEKSLNVASLGETVLKSETAAISAVALVSYLTAS